MKKNHLLTLLLALAVLGSVLTGILIAGAAEGTGYAFESFGQDVTDKHAIEIAESATAGVRIGFGGEFDAVSLSVCTWGTTDSKGVLRLYKWEKNHRKTVEGTPIAEKSVDGFSDNALVELTFDAQPAGEYFLTLTNTSGRVGVWAKDDNSITKSFFYGTAGEETIDLRMGVHFTGKPRNFFTVLSAEDNSTDIDTSIPADSLFHQNKAMPDTWVFTDGLGRISYTFADVGGVREGKTLALFYWDWHEELGQKGATNTTELMKKYPEAKNNYNHPAWANAGFYCFWNEPIYGFYRTSDEWVLRKQAELLAAAGVDVVFNDNTNGNLTWRSGYRALFESWGNASKDGVTTPKISFMLPFGANADSRKQLISLYNDIYKNGTYQDQWYYLDGKPMLIAHKESLTQSEANILDFFTFRGGQPSYTTKTTVAGTWGWLSTYPQALYYKTSADVRAKMPEQITVGVAVNHNYVTKEITAMNGEHVMGRSYTKDYPDRYEKEGASASLYGYQFSEQFDYALQKDPSVIFVTGWNEWHAWRQPTPWGGTNSQVNNALVDQFDNEFSRDLEPSKGELKDHYYYLFVNYVRKYKGVNPIPTPSFATTIDMSAGETQWMNVAPYYASYANNIGNRDHVGYKGYSYKETSGRNDLIGAQVARDDEYLYFHAECASDIVGREENLWMTLYLDTDQNAHGWETFDYVINKSKASENAVVLEKFTGDGYQTEKVAECAYTLSGRYLTIKVKKADLGISGDDYTVNFAWTDNVHDERDYSTFSGDIMDFYISGDVMPGGRFKYSFVSTKENSHESGEETTVEKTTAEEITTSDSSETEAPQDTTEQTTAQETTAAEGTTDAGNNAGCGSLLAVTPLLLALPAALLLRRKKEND